MAEIVLTPEERAKLRTWGQKGAVMPRERPSGLNPPTSAGPINSPVSAMRNATAGKYNLSDDARQVLSQTPISLQQPGEGGETALGHYDPSAGSISLGDYGYPPTGKVMTGTLGHEFAHQWQYEKNPDFHNPNYQQQMLSDTGNIAQNSPDFQAIANQWNQVAPTYANDLGTRAEEMNARLAAYPGPSGMPQYYQDRYYPGMYRGSAPTPPPYMPGKPY
jgi:hypothetical protein